MSNTTELKFLQPVVPTTSSDPLFADATGNGVFLDFSTNASGSLTQVEVDTLVNGGIATALAEADANFFNDPVFSSLFTAVSTVGEDGAFETTATSTAEVIASFSIQAHETFSFDYIFDLAVNSKEIEQPDQEYAKAKSNIGFLLLDTTDSNNHVLIDYFTAEGTLISSQHVGDINFGSSANATIDFSNQDLNINGDDGTDSAIATVVGNYSRQFSSARELTLVEFSVSKVHLLGDTFIDKLGHDVIYGSIWDNYLEGTHYNDKIYASLGNDTVKGYAGDDIIEGGGGHDWLYGGDGRDSIHGGTGDDYIDGGYGLDYIDGGSGYDTVSYAPRWNDVHLNLATGIVTFSGTSGSETIHNIEKVIGSQGNDIIYGDDGDNHLEGYHGYDYINGGAGNDYIDGGYDYDTLDGGTGYDTVSYAARYNDLHLDLKTGVVTFSGYSGTERVYNFEKVIGSQGNDTIYGDDGDNHLDGYHGHDYIHGGLGNDYIEGGAGGDTILGDGYYWGVSGNDTIDGGTGHDWIKAGGGLDTVKGGAGNDTIYGDYVNEGSGYDGDDFLLGGTGHDIIVGGGGNDRIIGSDSYAAGGHEQDILEGGSGADVFVLGDAHQAYYIANGNYDFAEIEDFTVGEDLLELHGSVGEYHVGISDGDAYISHTGNGTNDLVAIVENVYSSFDLNSNAVFV
ncbi:MAG: calcium-binding protein [Nostocaceae cyanobacterium]|nr:calcium-binding protein [Nostocaceae cyanobacterium]